MSVEVTNESGVNLDLAWVPELVGFACQNLRVHPDADVAVIFVDTSAMEQLHVQWMGETGPTDVLSFPMDELRPARPGEPPMAGILGDIVVCPEVAGPQGERAGHGLEGELKLLVTHGLLHLLGFDHAEPDEEKEMFGLQDQILSEFAANEKGAP